MKNMIKIFKALENYGLVIKSSSKTTRIACMVDIKLFYYGLISLQFDNSGIFFWKTEILQQASTII